LEQIFYRCHGHCAFGCIGSLVDKQFTAHRDRAFAADNERRAVLQLDFDPSTCLSDDDFAFAERVAGPQRSGVSGLVASESNARHRLNCADD
jgi:hypothetical protein